MATTQVNPKPRPKRRRKRPAATRRARRRLYARWFDSRSKRVADVALAVPLLLASLPLLLLCGAWIRWTSPGPAIFRQTRTGRHGAPFTLFKMRTMYTGSDSDTGPRWTTSADPRVIRGGQFVRRFHLDELPQLWNVLCGEMSLVGPRPERPEILRTLRSEIPAIDERVAARPGITGLGQVTLPPDGSVESVSRKLSVDREYLRKSSFRLDCRIIGWTMLKLLGFRRGWIYARPAVDDVISMSTFVELAETQPFVQRSAGAFPESGILLTVLMPVRNEGKHLQRTLEALRVQDLESFEVLLADGSSDDDTLGIARRMCDSFPQLKIFRNPGQFSSAGRNVGLQHARGRYVVVIDGHCRIPEAGYLRRVVEEFERSGAAMLGRPQPLKYRSKLGEAIARARRSRLGHNPDSAIYSDGAAWMPGENVAVAYRREIFDHVGVFDERFDACEDVEFNRRCDAAGFKCWFTPRIALPYAARETLGGLWRQMVRYGSGRARLAKAQCRVTLPALAPPAFLLYLLALPLLLMASLWWVTPVAAWLMAVAWESRHDPFRMPFVFAAIHTGFGWGYLRGLFSITVGMVTHRVTGAAAHLGSPARSRPSSSPPPRLRRTG